MHEISNAIIYAVICYFLWWMSSWLSTFPLVGELTTNTHTICFRADEFGVTLMLRGPLPHTVDTGTSPEQSSQCADQRTPGEHSGVPRSIYNCRTVQLLLLLGGVYQSLTSLTSKFSFVALPSPFSSLPLQRHPPKIKEKSEDSPEKQDPCKTPHQDWSDCWSFSSTSPPGEGPKIYSRMGREKAVRMLSWTQPQSHRWRRRIILDRLGRTLYTLLSLWGCS